MIRRLPGGFAAFHALNMVLNLVYTLLQLVAITRAVDPDRYAGIVFLVSIGFYFQPLDQAIGRANFIRLSKETSRAGSARPMHEISLFETSHTTLMLAVCFVFPLFFHAGGVRLYLEDSFLLVSILLMNSWGFNLQPIAWALGLEFAFSVISLVRRAFHVVGLAVLWCTGSMLLFCVIVGTSSIAFHVFARVWIARRSTLVPIVPNRHMLANAEISRHLRQIGNSFLSSLSELLVLNSPYVLIALLYGASPLMVVFDSIMKVARPSMTAARVFVETQIPHVRRLMLVGQTDSVERSIWYTTAMCAIGSVVLAGIVLLAGEMIFQLLLGQNNLVSRDNLPAAAAIVLAATLYQPIFAFLSYGDFQPAIKRFAGVSLVGFAGLGLLMGYAGGDIQYILWLYVAYCSVCLLIGAWLLHLQLGARRGKPVAEIV